MPLKEENSQEDIAVRNQAAVIREEPEEDVRKQETTQENEGRLAARRPFHSLFSPLEPRAANNFIIRD